MARTIYDASMQGEYYGGLGNAFSSERSMRAARVLGRFSVQATPEEVDRELLIQRAEGELRRAAEIATAASVTVEMSETELVDA